jgi:hypothetical protein
MPVVTCTKEGRRRKKQKIVRDFKVERKELKNACS